jgi:hypothetical protein
MECGLVLDTMQAPEKVVFLALWLMFQKPLLIAWYCSGGKAIKEYTITVT